MERLFYYLIISFLAFSCGGKAPAVDPGGILCQPADRAIADTVLQKFAPMDKAETGLLVREIALYFVGTPYVAHTLETGPEEKMVVNLREMDCTTFAENCLALARTVKMKNPGFEKFTGQLEKIRYRGGVRNGYLSRLHYFSDWIYDNDARKTVRSLSQEISHMMVPNQVSFMSTHPDGYSVLKDNPVLTGEMAMIEKEISQRMTWFIPRSQLAKAESQLKDGDIVGITTDIEGLDITHVVIAYRVGNAMRFIHASSGENKVVVSEQSLQEYLDGSRMATGIMVARPL